MTTTNRIVLSVQWSVKYNFCSEFPYIPGKSWLGEKTDSKVVASQIGKRTGLCFPNKSKKIMDAEHWIRFFGLLNCRF